jgi:UDP-glucose 4-epimerase
MKIDRKVAPGHHLVLGGRGFIGRHVAVQLARAGLRVVIAGRMRETYPLPEDVRENIIIRDMELSSADWDALVERAAVVHHYAWGSIPASANANPAGDLAANVTPLLGLLDALRRRGGGRLVFASSGGTVYGKLRSIPVAEDHPLAPITAYGSGKATAEIYLGLYHQMHGVDCRIARIANPYGAGQNLSRGLGAVTTFLHNALAGRPIVIWGDGSVVRDYIHISDVSDALVTLATVSCADPGVFNIGTGQAISLNDIVAEIEAQLHRKLEVVRGGKRVFDVPISVLMIDRATKALNWVPRLNFSAGIALTLADMSAMAEFSTLHDHRVGRS